MRGPTPSVLLRVFSPGSPLSAVFKFLVFLCLPEFGVSEPLLQFVVP